MVTNWKNKNRNNKLINSDADFEYLSPFFLIKLSEFFLIHLINLLLIL